MAKAEAEIAAYNDFLMNNRASTEAGIKAKVQEYWKKGQFFSENQLQAEDKQLTEILSKIKDGTFGAKDVTSIVMHAPAKDAEITSALSTQLAAPIARYERIAIVCGPERFGCEFYFNKSSYVAQYSAVAKASEAPNFERYCAMVESKVDAMTEAVLSSYEGARAASKTQVSAAETAAVRGGLLSELAKLKGALSTSNPQTESGKRARDVGLRATAIGRAAAGSGDIEVANTAIQVAKAMLDVAIGVTPVAGFSRDVYEVVTGKDLLTGETLTEEQRLLSAIGVMTLGMSEEPRSAARVLEDLAGRDAQILDKQIFKVRAFKSDSVNVELSIEGSVEGVPVREFIAMRPRKRRRLFVFIVKEKQQRRAPGC